MPYTKIVCTIGPASVTPDVLNNLIQSGMDVARLNFAHGTEEEHAGKIAAIRAASAEWGVPVAILQDLAGPKIRVGQVPEPGLLLTVGSTLVLSACDKEDPYQPNQVGVTYKELADDVFPGDPILLADGLLELEVLKTTGTEVVCKVVTGGLLTSHKGINLPTRSIKASSLTPKDRLDLAIGLKYGVDFVGLSFVRSAADILEVKEAMGDRQLPVIAKIEKHEAVQNIDSILEVADGVMVARGDLGVEIPLEDVPGVQKMLIKKANERGKPVITATQMLRSMVDSPRPTRAEATDVYNAVLDGTDAVMLSEETAMGSYPVEAVRYMARIAKTAEKLMSVEKFMSLTPQKTIADSVAHATCELADFLGAAAVVASTVSGLTAKQIARFRPRCPIIALSPKDDTLKSLALHWGCKPFRIPPPEDMEDLIESSAKYALASGLVKPGDLVIITAGHPYGGKGTTNLIKVCCI